MAYGAGPSVRSSNIPHEARRARNVPCEQGCGVTRSLPDRGRYRMTHHSTGWTRREGAPIPRSVSEQTTDALRTLPPPRASMSVADRRREEERCQDHCQRGNSWEARRHPAGGEKNIADLRGHVIVIEALEDKGRGARHPPGTQPRKLWKERDERSSAHAICPAELEERPMLHGADRERRSPACPSREGNCMSFLIRRRGERNWHEPITPESHEREASFQKLLAHSLNSPSGN